LEAPRGIEELPEALGFTETPDLRQLRDQVVEATTAGSEEFRELATRYHLLAIEVVNQYKGIDFAKAQIGLVVRMGLIWRDGGKAKYYLEDLRDALTCTRNEQLENTAVVLEAAIQDAEEDLQGKDALE